MIGLQNTKVVVMNANVVSSTAAEVSDFYVDTSGFKYAKFIVSTPQPTTGGTSTFTSLVLKEGDSTTAISTTVLTGGTDFALPTSSDTATPACGVINLDLRKRKRYLAWTSQATAAAYVNQMMVAVLDRAVEAPNSATEAGATVLYNG